LEAKVVCVLFADKTESY